MPELSLMSISVAFVQDSQPLNFIGPLGLVPLFIQFGEMLNHLLKVIFDSCRSQLVEVK